MKKTIIAAGILTAAGFASAAQLKAYAAEESTTPTNETKTGLETGLETFSNDTVEQPGQTEVQASGEPKTDLSDAGTTTTTETEGKVEDAAALDTAVPALENIAAAGPAASQAPLKTPAITNGWNSNKTEYYVNGKVTTGQKNIDGYWYLFDSNGKKLTGFQDLDAKLEPSGAKTCYYNASGQMLYGQQNIDKAWYCFDLFTGAMFTGEKNLSAAYERSGAKTVYYNNKGQMQYGLASNGKYYDTVTGARQANKLVSWNGAKYYINGAGAVHKGEFALNGKWKYFDENGKMATGFTTLEKGKNGIANATKKVYYNGNGDMLYGQQNIGGKWYCFDNVTGKMFAGLTNLNGSYERSGAKTVLYHTEGHMLYGSQKHNGNDVYFDDVTGAMLKNTQKGSKYYGTNGYAVKGEVNVGGKWKYFDENGNMKTGFVKLEQGKNGIKNPTKTVYYNAKGEMLYGQQRIGKDWYCFDNVTGSMFTGEKYLDQNYEANGAKTVRYDSNGKMLYGFWTDSSSKKQKFYDKVSGALLKNGFVQDGGYRYSADSKGWITNKVEAKNMYGIDISNWQNGIEISKLDADFIIVKATEGVDWLDKCFDKFAKETVAAGKQLGFYHFANAKAGEAKKEANFFYNTVKPYIGQGVPILDWEADAIKLGTGYAKEFLDEFYRLSGVKPLVYTSASVTREHNWNAVANAGYKLWVAQYADMNPVYGHQSEPWRDNKGTGAWGSPIMHQYTSTGHINGYNGNLDLNIFYGSIGEWKSLAKINKY